MACSIILIIWRTMSMTNALGDNLRILVVVFNNTVFLLSQDKTYLQTPIVTTRIGSNVFFFSLSQRISELLYYENNILNHHKISLKIKPSWKCSSCRLPSHSGSTQYNLVPNCCSHTLKISQQWVKQRRYTASCRLQREKYCIDIPLKFLYSFHDVVGLQLPSHMQQKLNTFFAGNLSPTKSIMSCHLSDREKMLHPCGHYWALADERNHASQD